MLFVIVGKDYKYELEKLSRLFLPFEKFQFSCDKSLIENSENYILISSIETVNGYSLSCELKLDSKFEIRNEVNFNGDVEKQLAIMLFDCFKSITGYVSPWGILTGIRPAKLLGKLCQIDGEEKAVTYFKEEFLVNDKKTNLCYDCYKSEEEIINRSCSDNFSLYISIPFCPSRCNYCSFVSHSVEQAKKLIPQYIEFLCKEIQYTGDIASKLGLKLLTVYIGGGTPTTLSAQQLREVMTTIKQSFSFENLLEYTVEAGRPDTITKEKLIAIKQGGATRISINPQTMNDDVLKAIGRRHSVNETINAFNLAREVGFNNINMDLIAGLSGDTVESFKNSVKEVINLSPENVTVHSLSMKRASNLTKSSTVFDYGEGEKASLMVDFAQEGLSLVGILPYYMYRQSKTVGNLENVGYAKKGFECLYNVFIMDETHTILGCGASAVTKLREPNGNDIERVFNFKYPYEYINGFNEILDRKKGIIDFYNKYL